MDNFKFSQRWWKNSFDQRTVETMFKNIDTLIPQIKQFINKKEYEGIVKGHAIVHKTQYLQECVACEQNVPTESLTQEFVEKSISSPIFNSRVSKKVHNLGKAYDFLFQTPFFPNICHARLFSFDCNLARQIHRFVGEDIIENCGEYRTKSVMAAGYHYVYLNPTQIEKEMNKLFTYVSLKMVELKTLPDLIKLSAFFLVTFLNIHPFNNGNGRVGRLLASCILSRVSIVPISLYLNKKSREIYLECLVQAREFYPRMDPGSLASLIVESIDKNVRMAHYSMNVDAN